MSILNTSPIVDSRTLAWNPGERRFLGDISDIGGRFGRVYDDACDEGFTLRSSRTRRADIVFVVTREHRDTEGDTMYWDLVPADGSQVGFTVRIYND